MLEVLFELGKLLCAFPTPIQDIIPPIQAGKCNPSFSTQITSQIQVTPYGNWQNTEESTCQIFSNSDSRPKSMYVQRP